MISSSIIHFINKNKDEPSTEYLKILGLQISLGLISNLYLLLLAPEISEGKGSRVRVVLKDVKAVFHLDLETKQAGHYLNPFRTTVPRQR